MLKIKCPNSYNDKIWNYSLLQALVSTGSSLLSSALESDSVTCIKNSSKCCSPSPSCSQNSPLLVHDQLISSTCPNQLLWIHYIAKGKLLVVLFPSKNGANTRGSKLMNSSVTSLPTWCFIIYTYTDSTAYYVLCLL